MSRKRKINHFTDIVNLEQHPLAEINFRRHCQQILDREGVLILDSLLTPAALKQIKTEGEANEHQAYFCQQTHNVYLIPPHPNFTPEHPRNRKIVSSKGCIANDQIPPLSPLRVLYQSTEFRDFLKCVLQETHLYEYADPLSSINLHYARDGQELGWHFDNSSFAITLLIQKPKKGGVFEYVKDIRQTDNGEENYAAIESVIEGITPSVSVKVEPGALILFRGQNSLHRVTPVQGETTRMLAVLAYNAKPEVALSESARMTFYGRL